MNISVLQALKHIFVLFYVHTVWLLLFLLFALCYFIVLSFILTLWFTFRQCWHLFSLCFIFVLHAACTSASASAGHAHSNAVQGRSLSREGEESVGEAVQEEQEEEYLEEYRGRKRGGGRAGKLRRQKDSVDREDAELEEESEEGVAQRTVSETDLR